MPRKMVIAGSGFAGVWAALSAALAAALRAPDAESEIGVVSPTPHLHIRPRLYEARIENMAPDIGPLLDAVGVRYVAGTVESTDVAGREATFVGVDERTGMLAYDRLVLAVGSRVVMPDIPGLEEHAHNVDQLVNAVPL